MINSKKYKMIMRPSAVDCLTCKSRMQSFFSTLSDEEAKQLSINRTCGFFQKGQILFYEGQNSVGAYCIYNGKVKVSTTSKSGQEQIIRLAKDGDVVGYKGLISGLPYTVTGTVLEDSTICFIPKNIFLYYSIDDPKQVISVLKTLLDELTVKEKMLVSLSTKSVCKRVAETLLMLKEFYGVEKDGKTLRGYISREDISHIVGTATESVVRVLTRFRILKLISNKDRRIKILNPKKILEIAQLRD